MTDQGTQTSAFNPFEGVEAWRPNDLLPVGNHVCEIIEVERGRANNPNAYPQVRIRLANAEGSIQDWLTVIDSTLGRIVMLTEALGLGSPSANDVEQLGDGYTLTESFVQRWLGKKVGTIVRDEPDKQKPGEMRRRVTGYVPVGRVAGSDIPSNFENGSQQPAAQQSTRIPF